MKPFKAAGLWRGEFGKGRPQPERCGECRNRRLEVGLLNDAWDQPDEEMARLYSSTLNTDDDDPRFYYVKAFAICGQCGWNDEYGPDLYYNPETNEYELPRPLSPEIAHRLELEAERQALLDAGQLELPL